MVDTILGALETILSVLFPAGAVIWLLAMFCSALGLTRQNVARNRAQFEQLRAAWRTRPRRPPRPKVQWEWPESKWEGVLNLSLFASCIVMLVLAISTFV